MANKILLIDRRNIAICLACPLPECVYMTDNPFIRQHCPIWRKEANVWNGKCQKRRSRRAVGAGEVKSA